MKLQVSAVVYKHQMKVCTVYSGRHGACMWIVFRSNHTIANHIGQCRPFYSPYRNLFFTTLLLCSIHRGAAKSIPFHITQLGGDTLNVTQCTMKPVLCMSVHRTHKVLIYSIKSCRTVTIKSDTWLTASTRAQPMQLKASVEYI